MSDLTETAERMARAAHEGDTYRDRPYDEAHLAPVVALLREWKCPDEAIAAGWLHDSLEMHPEIITGDQILERCGPDVSTIVEVLTHGLVDSYPAYITSIIPFGQLAIRVKLADNQVNLSNTRADLLDCIDNGKPLDLTAVRRYDKYIEAKVQLEAALSKETKP